jgi:hypothetical protein
MVAKITFPKKVEAALNYNEVKVQNGKAVCLAASGYLRESSEMNFYQKLAGFQTLNQLNERAATKTIHVSLNFDPSEKLTDEKLKEIAAKYMEGIGFGEQPYVVYKHEDAGHPHIHIVSTTIRKDSSRINTHNIGKNQSEKARKEIENQYDLIRAEKQKRKDARVKPIDAEKLVYGKAETKRGIANVVSVVFSSYKFTSLPEFNAALKQFNVVADRGKEEGRIYKNRGLVYRVLDADGNKVGVPVKASSIGCGPTLDNLEKKFTTNETAKENEKPFVKAKLDGCLAQSPASMNELIRQLQQKKIYTVLRKNAEGRLYGITFVDNQNRSVFNGSDLGKGYSAAAIQAKLSSVPITSDLKAENKKEATASGAYDKKVNEVKQKTKHNSITNLKDTLLDMLLAKEQFTNIPYSLLQKKKKKRRRNPNA